MFSPVLSPMTATRWVDRSGLPWIGAVRFWWRTMLATLCGALRPPRCRRRWAREQTQSGTASARSRLAGHDRQARPRLGHHRESRRLHANNALSGRVAGTAGGGAAGPIFFVTDLRSGKEDEIEAEHEVGLVFIDPKDKAYLSITATAQVLQDHAKAREIWKTTDDVWWDGPDDPNVCVLRVRPLTAELWDGPASKAVAMYEFAKAKLTGEKPNLGENRKVTVRLERQHVPTKRNSSTPAPSKTY